MTHQRLQVGGRLRPIINGNVADRDRGRGAEGADDFLQQIRACNLGSWFHTNAVASIVHASLLMPADPARFVGCTRPV
jgi:hypothetical protein